MRMSDFCKIPEKCYRCGYCCTKLLSVVVDDPEKGPVDGNFITNVDTRCKHLRGDIPGEFSCTIHDYPWYKDSPCAEYPGPICRIGPSKIEEYRKVFLVTGKV